MSATRRAEIGSRGFALRSWREYGNQGMTAVIRFADASFAAWIISSSSIRFLSTGGQPVWTMKTSEPRIDSSYRQYVSSFANVFSVTSPGSTPRCSPILCASSGCDRPEKTINRFQGPRSIQWPGRGCALAPCPSRPGSASSVVPISMLLVDPAFFGRLARREACQRTGRNIISDDRARRKPRIVADLDRSNERIVDTGPDVAADHRASLAAAGLVRIVGGDVACGDIRLRAD